MIASAVVIVVTACGGAIEGNPTVPSSAPTSSPVTTIPGPEGYATTTDGKMSITTPETWKAESPPPESGTFELEESISSAYLRVSRDSRPDRPGLEEYARFTRDWLDNGAGGLEETRVSTHRTLTINGHPAQQWESDTTNEGVDGYLLCTVIEGRHAVYTILGSSLASEAGVLRWLLSTATDSFQEIGP